MIEYMTPSIAANPPGEEIVLDQAQLWQGLLWKAEFAQLFVKPILDCRVIERFDDGILREIDHETSPELTEVLYERIFYEPQTKMTFLRLNGSVLGQIVNEILPDENGGLALRFGFTLALEGAAHGGPEEAAYLEKFSQGYIVAVEATLAAVRDSVADGSDPTRELAERRSEQVGS
jgi:hypothetical protein